MQPSFNTVVSRNEIDTNLISKLAAKTKQETETKNLFVESRKKKKKHFWSKKKSSTGQDLKQNAKFRHTYKLRPKCASKSALMMSLQRTTNGSFSNFLKLSCAKVQRTSYNTDSLYSCGRLSTLLVSERLLLLRWNKQKYGFNNRDHQTTQSKAKGAKNTQGQKTKTMSKRPNQKKQKYAQKNSKKMHKTQETQKTRRTRTRRRRRRNWTRSAAAAVVTTKRNGRERKEGKKKKRANHKKENPKQNQKHAAYLLT
jgi:hypothetical protein